MSLCKPSPNTIINGDCALVMAGWESEIVDLTVTSPPYDNLRDYEGYHFDFEAIAQQLFRVTKQGGVVVWVVGDETIDFNESLNSFRQAIYFQDIGFSVESMIYERESITWNESSKRYKQNFEFMFILSKGKPNTFNPIKDVKVNNLRPRKAPSSRNTDRKHYELVIPNNFTARGNIWRYVTGSSNDSSGHPAPFPPKLAHDHIISWSNPGDLVLDPMCGSGTTLKMAKQTGRDWIGIDMSEKYCKLSEKRVEGAQTPLLLEFGQSNNRVQPTGGTVRQNELFPNE